MSFNEQQFRQLISGHKSGVAASAARGGLSILSIGYRFGICCRNAMFDLGIQAIRRIPVPVISVGNVTAGGTGKTPVVAWFVHQLQMMNARPGIISRGYRAVDESGNDEKRVLEKLCPGVPHAQNPSRWLAAQSLLAGTESPDAIVMDDGFQHRQLHRDLNVLLIDATNPFGFDRLLPRGFLREPLSAIQRADVVLITRSDMVTSAELALIRHRIQTVAPRLSRNIIELIFRPIDLVDASGHRTSLAAMTSHPVLLISGIGNPVAFEATCRNAGLHIADRIWFPDHHHFTDNDLEDIMARAGNHQVVATLKDLVKLPASLRALALNIAAEIPDPEDHEMLRELLRTKLTPL